MRPWPRWAGKGLFVKEIEEALLEERVDLAVHSIKDVPTEFPEGLHLAAITKREDPRDVFISRDGTRLQHLSRAQRSERAACGGRPSFSISDPILRWYP